MNTGSPWALFFAEFSDYLETIVLSKEQLLIVGDFDIQVDVIDYNDYVKLLDLPESFGLQQHVIHTSHTHGHMGLSKVKDNWHWFTE